MILIHEGVPGSGKSYDALRKIIDALKAGRTVYTNIDGANVETCREAVAAMVGVTRDNLSDRYIFLTPGQVPRFWDFCPPGSFIVIDEAQLFFNSRDFNKESNREFGNWASTHRHQGYDLLLITQRHERIETSVRSLAEYRYRYKKINFFGSLVKRGYLVYTYFGEDPKPLTKPARRTYDLAVFRCYQSYIGDATEKSVQKNVNLLNHPLFYALGVLIVLAVWSFSKSSFATGDPLGYKNVAAKAEAIKNKGKLPVGESSPAPVASSEAGEPGTPPADVPPSPENSLVCLPMSAYLTMGGRVFVQVQGKRLHTWEKIDPLGMYVWLRVSDVPPGVQI